ncbi:hypothetical protein DSUL_50297 [Desulfovibrionales bacterium]
MAGGGVGRTRLPLAQAIAELRDYTKLYFNVIGAYGVDALSWPCWARYYIRLI